MELNEQNIANYLLENPEFFERNSELLLQLRLHHQSGRAVSLIEKQVSTLRERNTELRNKLNNLLANARDNDRLFERSKRLVLSLIECHEPGDIIDAIKYSFDKEFGIPYVNVIFFNAPNLNCNTESRALNEAEAILDRKLYAQRAVSGGFDTKAIRFLFGDQAGEVSSAAMAPLYTNLPFGILAIGHSDPGHFQSGMGTLFLTHIADVLSRLFPRYLHVGQQKQHSPL